MNSQLPDWLYHVTVPRMSKVDKLIARMRNNPQGWDIETLKGLAERYGITHRQYGTSHVVFRRTDGKAISVPAHRPIKPVYIRAFLTLLEE
ncbi:hypothetical protein [Candidatus Magnetaquicoccus inordinatus]|uniref:hypothetical protein n=1 Tax=Candidatus Magnetaquicoccus inordinatus TaxID=2496818 RepID=UPI001D0F1090|nr:hypothetical protein [Candidatus Magnetaquicoccus inordinatus]